MPQRISSHGEDVLHAGRAEPEDVPPGARRHDVPDPAVTAG